MPLSLHVTEPEDRAQRTASRSLRSLHPGVRGFLTMLFPSGSHGRGRAVRGAVGTSSVVFAGGRWVMEESSWDIGVVPGFGRTRPRVLLYPCMGSSHIPSPAGSCCKAPPALHQCGADEGKTCHLTRGFGDSVCSPAPKQVKRQVSKTLSPGWLLGVSS